MNHSRLANQACPCGSGKTFTECCEPVHQASTHAATAEQLMRSRYSAFVVDNLDYLLQSWHPSTRPVSINPNEPGLCWQQLEIISTHGGQTNDEQGEVEFIAHYMLNGQAQQLHERSRFVRVDKQWTYLDGYSPALSSNPGKKPGRNTPCHCGSGKKYKHCCMR